MRVSMKVTGFAVRIFVIERSMRYFKSVFQLSCWNGLRQPCRLTQGSMETHGEGTVAAISPLHHLNAQGQCAE